ncbi:MAG: DUF3604 domain-containing protein [Proteobacteria bacterium]|nr:DUF3604 domain-containing protein [Pseudomonadota bacterium]
MSSSKAAWFGRTGLKLAMALIIALVAAGAHGVAADYLPSDLRAQVERLKADSAESASDASNQRLRAEILWHWANAYAVNGGELPVNLTQIVAAVLRSERSNPNVTAALDAYIGELTLLDEKPLAIGSLTADEGPFEAASFVSIRQTYRVGQRAMTVGAGFLIARHFMPNFGLWQASDPQGDNFIAIASSNESVSFVSDTAKIAGMHGGFRESIDTLVFRVATGTLSPDDTVTITYGDQTQGSRGLLMPTFSSDRMPLPIYLAFERGGHFFTLPIQPIVVSGTQIARVRGFAPSVVDLNEKFTLSVRAEDRYFNRATGDLPEWTVTVDGERVKTIPAGGKAITLIHEITLPRPGVYHFRIESADGEIVGSSNPVLAQAKPGNRIYWGDTHGHSGFAEGIGTPDRFMSWARDDARLDYVTHSEHDIWMDDYEWSHLRDNVRKYSAEGSFIAYLGYEWSVQNVDGGHHNVLYRTPENRKRISSHFYPRLSDLYQGLRETADTRDIVIIPHAHQAGDYRQNDPALEPLIEIMSQHGTFEWFGRMYLNHGHQAGFTAASDNHLSQPGYSAPLGGSLAQRGGLGAVLASNKTTDGLFDAMKNLKTYATSGERMILQVSLNGAQMGDRTAFAEDRKVVGRVIGTAPIDTITLIKNDEQIWQQDLATDQRDRLDDEGIFLLGFSSDSAPAHPGDNPRGFRGWSGTIEVVDADLSEAQGTDFHNHIAQSLEIDTDNPNLIHFSTLSRGNTSSLKLNLTGVKRSTHIKVALVSLLESGGAPPIFRRPQRSAESAFTLRVRDLVKGQVEEQLPMDEYVDRVSLRRVLGEGSSDVQFEFTDSGGKQGDYYYVRVKQVDDATAWSSPIWVGGYAKK